MDTDTTQEAQGLEVFTVPGRYLSVDRKNPGAQDVVLLSDATAVIDQLRAENEVLTLRVMAGERQELAALKSTPVVMPEWATSYEALGQRLLDAGWRDYADAQWDGVKAMFAELNRSKT